ncbi:hypothetical protein TNCV_1950381 [Trichonephila clavipes]|nr:hypothetical protein TNCV_1950381 [Trichonephila clavipes]
MKTLDLEVIEKGLVIFLKKNQNAQRYLKVKALLRLRAHNGHKILFTDVKIFDMEESFNHQKDHVHAKIFQEANEKKNAGRKLIAQLP